MNRLDEVIHAKVWERLLFAAVNAVVDTLPLRDRLLHFKLDFVRKRLDQLQQVDHQDEARLAAINELEQILQCLNDLHALLKPLLEVVEGSISVDDRVTTYWKEIDNKLPSTGCEDEKRR